MVASAGLVSVKVCAGLEDPITTVPKSKLAGVRAGGGPAVPVPSSVALTPPELALDASVPLEATAATGAKRVVTVQVADAASVPGQVSATISNGAEIANGVRVIETGAGLPTVKTLLALTPPTSTGPKLCAVGVIVAGGGAAPLPLNVALTPPELAVDDSVPVLGPRAEGA